MNLKSISEIRALSEVDLASYIEDLRDNYGYRRSIIASIMQELRQQPESQTPLSPGVFYRFLWHMRAITGSHPYLDEGFDIPIGEDWCTEHITTIRWYNARDQRITSFLTASQYDMLTALANSFEGGHADEVLANFHTELGDPTSEEDLAYAASIGLTGENPNLIPENSGSLSVRESTSRFSSAMWFEAIQDKVITLAGVGGIGSYVGFLLARMRPRALFIYDDDRVEAANMSGQLYSKTDIGQYKVDALAAMVENYADYNSVFAISQRFTEQSEPSQIMICGFDNMAARKLFFEKWASLVNALPEDERCHCLYIDGRLAAEELQVYCITGDNSYGMDKYRETLFTDEQADETVCSYKQTTYMANLIGSIIVNLFTNFVANELLGFLGRDLPFLTSYNGLSMQFKVE